MNCHNTIFKGLLQGAIDFFIIFVIIRIEREEFPFCSFQQSNSERRSAKSGRDWKRNKENNHDYASICRRRSPYENMS